MTLEELIHRLEAESPETRLLHGFGTPHSYRGHYERVAFEPIGPTTIGIMLDFARACVGRTFGGYKGGEYVMRTFTECHLAPWGDCGPEITPQTIDWWLAEARLALYEPVVRAAEAWWSGKKPLSWTDAQHVECWAVNCTGENEKALAAAVAAARKGATT